MNINHNQLDIFCDGGARGNPGPAAVGVVIKSGSGDIAKIGQYIGFTTNNTAEYQSVKTALSWLKHQAIKPAKVNIYLDSLLVVRQLKGEYRVKKGHLQQLLLQIKILEQEVGLNIYYQLISRQQNFLADSLVNKTLNYQAKARPLRGRVSHK